MTACFLITHDYFDDGHSEVGTFQAPGVSLALRDALLARCATEGTVFALLDDDAHVIYEGRMLDVTDPDRWDIVEWAVDQGVTWVGVRDAETGQWVDTAWPDGG